MREQGSLCVIEAVNSPRSLEHNHPRPRDLSSHVQYRREIKGALDGAIKARFRAGETPSMALDSLREQYPDAKHLTRPDIHNRFALYRREELEDPNRHETPDSHGSPETRPSDLTTNRRGAAHRPSPLQEPYFSILAPATQTASPHLGRSPGASGIPCRECECTCRSTLPERTGVTRDGRDFGATGGGRMRSPTLDMGMFIDRDSSPAWMDIP